MSQDGSRARKSRDLRNLIGLLMGVSAASTAMAQTVPTTITVNSSFGRTPGQIAPSATNTTVTGNRGATYNVNNLYTIAESRGRTAGANLFHSFGTFNVGAGDAAVFTTTTPTLQNIIARVSGPSASTIQGLLAVNAAADSAPNLYFINPAGVTFGAGAQVNVPAAFHVSTANELRFADGTTFKAGAGPDSSMTMAAPEAFGFVGGNGDIAFNGVHADLQEDSAPFVAKSFDVTAGSVTFDNSNISVPEAQVRIVGAGVMAGSIPIEGVPTGALQGNVRFKSSRLDVNPDPNADLLEDDSPTGDFPIDFPTDEPFPIDDFPTDDGPPINFPPGNIPISGNTTVRTGSILLLGRDVALDNSGLSASGLSDGAVRIRAAGDVTLTGDTLLLALVGSSGGRTGTIEVVAQGAIDIAGVTNVADGSDTDSGVSNRRDGLVISTAVAIPDVAAVRPGGGIVLDGGSVSVRNALLDATFQSSAPVPIEVFGAPPNTSSTPQNPTVSILSGSFITLENTLVAADSSLEANAPGGSILVRSSGGGDIVLRDSALSNMAFLVGRAGPIQVDTAGDVQLFDSIISSEAFGSATGTISLRGNEIGLHGQSFVSVDLGAIDFDITAPSDPSIARVGSITLDAVNRVVVNANSTISARSGGETRNPSARGQIRINTPRLDIDGQITTEALGNLAANDIVIDAGNVGLTLQGSGVITSSSTEVSEVGQRVAPTADGDDESPRSNPFRGAVIDIIIGEALTGDAGTITVLGQDVTINGVRLSSRSDATSSGDAGSIQVTAANNLTVSGAQLQTDTAGRGAAGNITLASRTGSIDSSQISSQASADSSGQTGTIALGATQSLSVTGTTVSIANDANVMDPTRITQGRIAVDAPTLVLKNSALSAESTQNVTASAIAINATSGATLDTSSISSSARGTAAAGDISIHSNGIVALTDSRVTGEAPAAATSQLTVTGSEVNLNGVSRLSTSLLGGPTTTTGGVGAIRVAGTNKISVDSGSSIEARTVGSFDNPEQATPGEVRLTTPRLEVAGTITTETLGNVAASNIVIHSDGPLTVTGTGVLTSSTSGSGNAGNIDIGGTATSLTGVMVNSASTSGSSGNAGTVTLRAAEDLAIVNATVRTDTAGSGKAGNITLAARTITIDPSLISSQAASGSSGQTGTIDVTASKAIELRDSTLSIANAARVADPSMTPLGQIRLGAPVVKLLNSNVTAQSSENVAASAIAVASDKLTVRNSNITTSAQDGNGGNIDVVGQRFIVLDKSQVSTSVLGTQSGSGGDITVRSNVLVVNTGFIQANTAAPGASGGNVTIAVGQLLPVGALVTGGDVPLLFDPQRSGINAIQAAAPDGISGTIQFAGPALDVVGNLQSVEAEFVATGPLGQDLCRRGSASSLTQVGRGGLRPLSTGLMRPDTSLPLLPELPALSLRLDTQAPSSGKCGS